MKPTEAMAIMYLNFLASSLAFGWILFSAPVGSLVRDTARNSEISVMTNAGLRSRAQLFKAR